MYLNKKYIVIILCTVNAIISAQDKPIDVFAERLTNITEFINKKQKQLIDAIKKNNLNDVKKMLDDKIINVNTYDPEKPQTPLMLAITTNSDISIIKLLIDAGADINAIDQKKESTLQKAIRLGDPTIVREILKNKDLILRDQDKDLHIPAYYGYIEILPLLLLDDRFDINYKDKDGHTALHIAVKAKFTDQQIRTIKLLIEHGADKKIKNNVGQTAYDIAKNNTIPKDVLDALKP